MIDIFKFSNWNQLSGLKSSEYPNLEIHITQFNSVDDLVGTRVSIVDIYNNTVYFAGFVRVVSSTKFDPLSVFEIEDMIKRINSYGFHVEITEPISLQPNVITILKGLYSLGYNYITLQYINTTNTKEQNLYQSNVDSKNNSIYFLPPVVYSNKYVVATKNLGDIPSRPSTHCIPPVSKDVYIISKAPEFNWEDFKWVQPTRIYSIELLLEENLKISDAIISTETEKEDESGD